MGLKAWNTAAQTFTNGVDAEAMAQLAPHVAKDCIFKAPTYFKPWQGRAQFLILIQTVTEVFGSSFQYRRKWISPDARDWCLEFTANVQGNELTGVDLVHFDVALRPPKAVAALLDEMGKRIPARMAELQKEMKESQSQAKL